MLNGESWFPITGNIILRDNKPIASVPDDTEAFHIMRTIAKADKGVLYTCLSHSGWHCQRFDEPKDKEKDDA